ncbi:MAG: c-type cytochrome, partial [Planctomycetales bacterium]|nr:c-type cytochrome [Planctomycetales bacterium]
YPKLEADKSSAAADLQIGIIAIMGDSADDASMEFLRGRYGQDVDKQAYLAMALAQRPEDPNWGLLVDALRVVEGGSAQMVLQSLARVNLAPEQSEPYRQVIIRGLELGDHGAEHAVKLLEHWTGEQRDQGKPSEKLADWQAWFAQKWPTEPPAALPASTQESKWVVADLLTHLESGEAAQHASAERGAAIFNRAQCAKCHRHGDTGEGLGPDLTNVGRRFRKKDILESIIYPSHVISDQYRSKTLITTSGQQFTGIVSRGAPGELVVLQADGQKVVLRDSNIDEVLPSKLSAMPEGLLEGLSLEEVTDLFTYLQSNAAANTASRPTEPRE